MATSSTVSANSATLTSFAYESLLSHVQMIQEESVQLTRFLDEQRKNGNALISRSLTFVDPFGNSTVHKCMDHERISDIFRKYKKEYVPKYLQRWIKLGSMNGNTIEPMNDYELLSTASEYNDGYQFITYGNVSLRTGTFEDHLSGKLTLPVLLTDKISKIILPLTEIPRVIHAELKSLRVNPNTDLNGQHWTDGHCLTENDTIVSAQLYHEDTIIMAKLIKTPVNDQIASFTGLHINIFFRLIWDTRHFPWISW